MTLPKPQAVLFDWDNTLVDTWPVIHSALHTTFTEMGVEPWSLAMTKARVRKSMRDSFPEIFGNAWEQASKIYQQAYQSIHLLRLRALPGAEETLKLVKEQGLYSAVVSNKKGVNLRKELKHIGWSQYFNTVVGADDAKRDKPHADPVHMALEGSNIQLTPRVWFVGDSEIDLECAGNVGATPILYGDITPDGDGQYNGHAFLHHVKDHAELVQLFKHMTKAA